MDKYGELDFKIGKKLVDSRDFLNEYGLVINPLFRVKNKQARNEIFVDEFIRRKDLEKIKFLFKLNNLGQLENNIDNSEFKQLKSEDLEKQNFHGTRVSYTNRGVFYLDDDLTIPMVCYEIIGNESHIDSKLFFSISSRLSLEEITDLLSYTIIVEWVHVDQIKEKSDDFLKKGIEQLLNRV